MGCTPAIVAWDLRLVPFYSDRATAWNGEKALLNPSAKKEKAKSYRAIVSHSIAFDSNPGKLRRH